MDVINDARVLSNEMSSHSLSDRGNEGVSDQCRLKVDYLLLVLGEGLLLQIVFVDGGGQLREVLPSVRLSGDQKITGSVLWVLLKDEGGEKG